MSNSAVFRRISVRDLRLRRPESLTAVECFRRGESCFARNEVENALRYYDEALRLGIDENLVVARRWNCLMLLGEFERAWRETDRTEAIRRAAGETTLKLPRHLRRVWNGSPLNGRSVLVRCYHGLGDTIHFVRFVPMLRELARSVTLQCQPRLAQLLGTVAGIDRMAYLDDSYPELEVDIEVMELAYAFRVTPRTIPSTVPYLHIAQETVARQRIALANDGFKIGLVWCGGDWDPSRSMSLCDLEPLSAIPGITLYSFQYGAADQEIDSCRARLPLIRAARESLIEEAATMLNMDLVVSVDTMAAHLAGALGIPVWLLLPFIADWRWMVARNDSPWYPSMRLFRQPRPGDWVSVIRTVCSELERAQHPGP